MGRYIAAVNKRLSALAGLTPLFFRLILVYGFFGPAIQKLNNFQSVVEWFNTGLHLPFPLVNAVLAVSTETAGCVLLALGLATRFISIPLMVTMVVAIATVHYGNGFTCANNGFEIPFYYLVMLLSLVFTGAGQLSLDHLIARRTAAY